MSTDWSQFHPAGRSEAPATDSKTEAEEVPTPSLVDSRIVAPLLIAYVVAIFFPTVTRFSESELSIGVSTLIVIALVGIGLPRVFRAIARERLILLILGFFAYLLIPTALGGSLNSAFSLLIMMIYVGLAAMMSQTDLTNRQYERIWSAVAFSILVSSLLTLVDFMGLVDIPFCNEVSYDTKIAGERTAQASGFFEHRSAMAAVFSLGVTGCVIAGFTHPSKSYRFLMLLSAAIATFALFLTHNRSGVLGAILVAGIYAVVTNRIQLQQRIGMLIGGGFIGLILIAAAYFLFPEHLEVYVAKLGFLGLADETWGSDGVRVELFIHAILELGSSPLGNGLTHIEITPGLRISPHNIVTQIIWAGGIVALIWLPIFALVLLARLGLFPFNQSVTPHAERIDHALRDAYLYALLAWFVNGMTHQILSTGLAWVFLGIALRQARPASRRATI